MIDDTKPALGVVSSSTHPNANVWYATDDGSLSWVFDDTAPIDGYSFVVTRPGAGRRPGAEDRSGSNAV